MPLPASFLRDGFSTAREARKRMRLPNGRFLHPLTIGTEGQTNTGKTEFLLSCPGPGLVIALDRGLGLIDNPHPPISRNPNFGWKVIQAPAATPSEGDTAKFREYFKEAVKYYYAALDNPDAVTVAIDGDSDFWELHRLAAFGKLTAIYPATRYTDVYAERRALTNRAWDKAKIVVATNKVRDEWIPVLKTDGTPETERDGTVKKQKSGKLERQGFPDQDYLWEIQLRHLYQPPRENTVTHKMMPGKWGIRILKCKHNPEMQGEELWGDDCNFRGLVQLIYPEVDTKEWNL